MIDAFFVFAPRGSLIVSKLISGEAKESLSEVFRLQVINGLEIRSPVLTLGSTTFQHIRTSGGLWMVVVVRGNADSAAIWEFLYHMNKLLDAYAINTEEALLDDFMLCYELLDVVLDSGLPQDTELSHIVPLLSRKPATGESASGDDFLNSARLRRTGTKNVSVETLDHFSRDVCPWRGEGIKYKKNEVYLDVIEKLSLLVNRDGTILKAYVDGTVQCTAHLSGMPLCHFGFNDSQSLRQRSPRRQYAPRVFGTDERESVVLEDCKFHQCVQLNKFDQERVIRFVPPDGEFELMKYHIRDDLRPPFKVTPVVSKVNERSIEYRITLQSLFPTKLSAKDVELYIPAPPYTISAKVNVSCGKCKFVPEENAIIWKIHKFHGLTENTLSAVTIADEQGHYAQVLDQWPRPPISLKFEIMMFSNSGLVVRYFKVVEKDLKYNTFKWVKYISRSGAYEIRY
ncbi:ADR315Wp [Eremothecium gossypii ATCC 10895]|uniref:ADR315Wp n=1 Tax=Eremothecium gossypii (strain ATCC 10895 / CBS 109.51 / FGSC 9923 / NRRL Y-1056) TaxID=284811 RepID=Q759G1_EREGS|nr:ADR315Wp [Eremothecium gossypii ATCC 10895]AAS52235.2 ADR315Wp [Eremothecium gossypii ATCC 10895]AEY96534.1 FADR315Wp [Eremothecium gossypii FDAG1]